MKYYCGRRDKKGNAIVRVVENGDARKLDPRFDLFKHSPTGFEWGYGGSGPAQLALAIIADVAKGQQDEEAVRLHQKFKWRVIAQLPRDEPWRLTELQVLLDCRDLVLEKREGLR